jgi:hypothetical protein
MLSLRHLLNGLIDTYLYYSGRVDTTLPFDELRRRSLINEAAQARLFGPTSSGRIVACLRAPTELALLYRSRDEVAIPAGQCPGFR